MFEKKTAISANYPIKSPLINVMTSAALKAAKGLVRDFGEVDNLQISRKGVANFVTESDLRAEKILRAELEKARPRFGLLLEESGEVGDQDAEYRWVVDPLDGTNNFIHAIPYFCISIGVERKTHNGFEIVAGVVYDPIHDEMFIAEKGAGAYVNHRRLRCAPRKGDFYFVTGTTRVTSPYDGMCSEFTRNAAALDSVIRRSGAAALDLAYVAAGRYDACWFPHLKKWDMAAGILIVKEAGGNVCMPGDPADPYETGCILAASPESFEALNATCMPKKQAASE